MQIAFTSRYRFVWLPANLLLMAGFFGLIAGAWVAMYYEVVPGIASREDTLSSIQAVLFGLAALLSFAYFPLALTTAKARQWTQASILAIVVATPLAIFLASEGLLSHYLWWGPISDTDRFHMLHHSLVAAVPLSIIYFLFLRWRWRPNLLTELGPPTVKTRLTSAVVLSFIVIPLGILVAGLQMATLLSAAALIGVIVFGLSALLAA